MRDVSVSTAAWIVALASLSVGGCVDWPAAHDALAREECRDIINADERMACFQRADESAYKQRRSER
jgi:hypothetical protein